MSERIQPKNNRTFDASSGDWAGDLVWHGDVFFGHQGYITVAVGPPPASKTISLQYPALKPVPGKENSFGFQVHYFIPSVFGYGVDFRLADGVYSYGDYIEDLFDNPIWSDLGIAEILPSDWNIENSEILITVSMLQNEAGDLAFDNFGLTAPGIPGYLPIMGIG